MFFLIIMRDIQVYEINLWSADWQLAVWDYWELHGLAEPSAKLYACVSPELTWWIGLQQPNAYSKSPSGARAYRDLHTWHTWPAWSICVLRFIRLYFKHVEITELLNAGNYPRFTYNVLYIYISVIQLFCHNTFIIIIIIKVVQVWCRLS